MAKNVIRGDVNSQRDEIFENSPLGILFFNCQGELIDVNPAGLEIMGASSFDSVKGLKIWDNNDIKIRAEELDKDKIIRFKSYLPVNFNMGNVFVDWIITKSNSGFLVQMKDITEEKQTEMELKESLQSESESHEESKKTAGELSRAKEEYRVMAETVPYGVWKTDAEGKMTYASPAFLELLKMIPSDLNEFNWMNNLPSEDVEKAIKKWRDHVKSDGIWNEEYKIQGHDKTYHTILMRGLPVYDKNGKIISWVGINLDFTEYKKIEDKLNVALEKAEGEVKEVLLKLANANQSLELEVIRRLKAEEELKKSVDELKRANKEIYQLTYIASHDLQEPLREIASYAGLIKMRYEGKLDKDADDFIDYMVSGTSRMKEMIQSLQNYAHIGSKKANLKNFNAEKALKNALNDLKVSIEDNNAKITYDLLPSIVADEEQIAIVFENLINNALKFRKKEIPPKIHISAQKKDNEYVFSVSDNGIGIETQYKDKIFEIFKRLHAIGEYKGAGIGLAIVKRAIDNYSGRVWVESELGKGSTFYFTIPIKE